MSCGPGSDISCALVKGKGIAPLVDYDPARLLFLEGSFVSFISLPVVDNLKTL